MADLLYLGLTTYLGNRTLGEEYCDILEVEAHSLRLPDRFRRAGYILSSVLLPYALGRILPSFRRRVRSRLERVMQWLQAKHQREKVKKGKNALPPAFIRILAYLHKHLDTITSSAPLSAMSLAVFYFSGAYYQISKRLWSLRYIFTRQLSDVSADQRVGYEILGVLLVLQLSVQAYLHFQDVSSTSPNSFEGAMPNVSGSSAVLDGGVEVSLDPPMYGSNNTVLFDSSASLSPSSQEKLARITHTPLARSTRMDLSNKDSMTWLRGRQVRKCTLCLEEMKDPSVTTCGHVFCWTCICDWCREKPECPLCRQSCLAQHVLPLRG